MLLLLDLNDHVRSLLDLLLDLLQRPLLLADPSEAYVALLITKHPVWLHSDKETLLEPEID